MLNRKKVHIWLPFICILLFVLHGPVFCNETEKVNQTYTASDPVQRISKIVIHVDDTSSKRDKLAQLARNILFVQEGDLFSTDGIQYSISSLKLSSKFSNIHIDSIEGDDGITLQIYLTPARYIKDIKFSGKYPLFEREIFNAMTIYPGDVFNPDALPEQSGLIRELYHREGFSDPEVLLTAEEDPGDGNYKVYVEIEKGPCFYLDELKILNNKAISDTRLKLQMTTWQLSLVPGMGGRFEEYILKKDIHDLIRYYRWKGFVDVEIDYTFEKDYQNHMVSVEISITEGPDYHVAFEDNMEFWKIYFWNMVLKKHLIFFEKGNKRNVNLRRSINRLKEYYHSKGYHDAVITLNEENAEEEGLPIRKLTFVIAEGPRTVVRNIQISGNQAYEKATIEKQMLTRPPGIFHSGIYVLDILDEDIQAITSYYVTHGYNDVVVAPDIKWNNDKTEVDVHLNISEGIQTRVSSILIKGLTVVPEEEARKAIGLKENEAFRKYMVQSDENKLEAMVSEKGYPHVHVKSEITISGDHSEAIVVYNVDEGSYVEMGSIFYTGNFRTKSKILKNEIKILPGEPFSLEKTIEGKRDLQNMAIFNSVQFKTFGLKERAEKVNLFIEVEERKPYYFEAGGGYESEKGLYAHSKIGDRNLFGINKNAWMDWEVSQTGYRGDIKIIDPRVFDSHTSATLGVFTEEKEEFNQYFGTRTTGTTLIFSRELTDEFTTGLGFNLEHRDQYSIDYRAIEKGDDSSEFDARMIMVVTPSISYDTRDSFIRPRRGILSSQYIDISRGIHNSLDDFIRYKFDFRYFYTPLKRLTFACIGRAGHIFLYDTDGVISDDQLFYLGGTSSVRGFKENMFLFDENGDPIGGRTSLSGSLEARIDIGWNFEFTCFYDGGSLTDSFDTIDSDRFRSSIGSGLRYITPIGPIGVMYGVKLDRKEGEDLGRFHFSVGYTF